MIPGFKMKSTWHKFKALFSGGGRYWGIIALIVLLLIPLELFIFSTAASPEDDLYWKSFLANNKIYSVPIPKDLQFAGEKVPVYDFTVIESMERELLVNTYFHSQTILMQKRANRWLPMIEHILKKNGVPDDFKYIALIESNLSNAISPKGATGFWQFIGSAAKQYGLEVSEDVDERYDVRKSTEAACRYFKDAYRTFGNWTLAAASYNVGIDGLQKQIDKQKARSYYDLSLNEETARYIFRILTVKEVLSHPKQYGYQMRKKDLYPAIPVLEVKTDSGITDLTAFALSNNVSYKILKYFNPWLRKNFLTNEDRRTYTIEIPRPGYNEEYVARLFSADSAGIRIGQEDLEKAPSTSPDSTR